MEAIRKNMSREQLFKRVIGENSQRIFRICSYFFNDRDDRNDAYQETLIRIWENLHSFKGNSLLSTWIYRVAVNSCLSHIRNDKKRNDIIENGNNPEVFLVAENTQEDDSPAEEHKKY